MRRLLLLGSPFVLKHSGVYVDLYGSCCVISIAPISAYVGPYQ